MFKINRIIVFIIFFLLTCTGFSHATARLSTAPVAGTKSLANYLSDIDTNFINIWKLIFVGEPGFTGISGEVITSGTVSASRIDSTIARQTDLTNYVTWALINPERDGVIKDAHIDSSIVRSSQLTSGLAGKMNLSVYDPSSTGQIQDSAIPTTIARLVTVNNLLTSKADLSVVALKTDLNTLNGSNITSGTVSANRIDTAIARVTQLPVAGTDFYSITATNNLLSTKANTLDVNAALNTKVDITTYVSGLAGKMNAATGTPDGTKFLMDNGSWQPIPGGGDMLSSIYLSNGYLKDTYINPTVWATVSNLSSGLSTKLTIPSGDGTRFYRNDNTWQLISGGGDMLAATYLSGGYFKDQYISTTFAKATDVSNALAAKVDTTTYAAGLATKLSIPTGTADGTKFVRDDNTYQNITKTTVGLSLVPNLDATNPANIVQTTNYRFVNDTEKNTWNNKQDLIAYTTENVANKALNLSSNDNLHYPTTAAVTTAFSSYSTTAAMNTAISSAISSMLAAPGVLGSTTPNVANIAQLNLNGANGNNGIWWSSVLSSDPTTATYGIYPKSGGFYQRINGVVSIIPTINDSSASASSTFSSTYINSLLSTLSTNTSLKVDSTTVTAPNLSSTGTVSLSVAGSNITANVKSGVLTPSNFNAANLITETEAVSTTPDDTSVMTSAAVDARIQHLVNIKLATAGFVIGNYITPLNSGDTTTSSSYAITGNVYTLGTTPTVTVSLNGGAFEAATVTGSSSPYSWSITKTLNVGSNTINVTIVNSNSQTLNMPQTTIVRQ